MKKVRKDPPVMDICLIIVAAIGIIFTTVMIYTYWKYGSVPDTLITEVYRALFGECGCLAVIKVFKEKYRDRKSELEDREYAEKQEEKRREEAGQYGCDPE